MTDLLIENLAVNTLVSLKLTVLQAKVYIALTKLGDSTGKATAKLAQVASQDVYRVLSELQEKGLVEKIISKPNKYHAIPMTQGLKKLLEIRQQETLELKKSVAQMSKNLNRNGSNKNGETGDFVLIANQEHPRRRNAVQKAKTCIDFMNDYENAMQGHQNLFDTETKLLENGIRIRNLLYKKDERCSSSKAFLALKKRVDFQIRLSDTPAPKLMIIDRKELFISTVVNPNSLTQSFLWSNNQVLVQAMQGWYDMIWEKSRAYS